MAERHVSGLTVLFPEGTHKKNRGCHKIKPQEKEVHMEKKRNEETDHNGDGLSSVMKIKDDTVSDFQMPHHYPKYTKQDYENMPEWELDNLLASYGLSTAGGGLDKRKFAIGAFVWPDIHGQVESSPSHTLQDSAFPKEIKGFGVEFLCRSLGGINLLKK